MPAQAELPWLLMAHLHPQLSIRGDSRPSLAHAAHLVPVLANACVFGGAKLNLFSASEIGPGVGRSVGWSESAQVCQIGSVGRSYRLGNAKV